MCGIAGVVGPASANAIIEGTICALSHRGPDASGHRPFEGCTLLHTRLRVIDLDPSADQPMSNEDGTVWVVFNREIYNFAELRRELRKEGHRFRSSSDTEVLVHLWERDGVEMVHQLEGMFAFAIWDDVRRRLLLARDRLGIKPLYYTVTDGGLRFGSEVRAVAEAGAKLDVHSVAGYARMGWVSGPSTIVSGVVELPPGHLLEWSDGQTRVRRWWATPPLQASEPLLHDPLPEALREAFRRQLVADVPVGLFLSGGIDSRVLAHLASSDAPSLHTYTVAFDAGPDESGIAAAEAHRLGLRHTTVTIGVSEILASIDDVVAAMDQPTVDGVNTWAISRAVRRAGAVVALSGLGGDELFGGYSTFRRVPLIAKAAAITGHLPRRWRHAGALATDNRRSHPLRRIGSALAGGDPWREAYASMRGITSGIELDRLWPGAPDDGLNGIAALASHDDRDTVTQLELADYLPNQLLRDTDAMSMAHSLKVRVPLLDELVLDAALRAPVDPAGRRGKERLAAAASPELASRAAAPKQTFTLPFDRWLRGPLAPRAREGLARLTDPDIGFDAGAVDALWARWEDGRTHWRTVWGLAVLGMWTDAR